jgi:hypothetical protein
MPTLEFSYAVVKTAPEQAEAAFFFFRRDDLDGAGLRRPLPNLADDSSRTNPAPRTFLTRAPLFPSVRARHRREASLVSSVHLQPLKSVPHRPLVL